MADMLRNALGYLDDPAGRVSLPRPGQDVNVLGMSGDPLGALVSYYHTGIMRSPDELYRTAFDYWKRRVIAPPPDEPPLSSTFPDDVLKAIGFQRVPAPKGGETYERIPSGEGIPVSGLSKALTAPSYG